MEPVPSSLLTTVSTEVQSSFFAWKQQLRKQSHHVIRLVAALELSITAYDFHRQIEP